MAKLIPDSIDFAAYERSTQAQVKVRKASEFAADVAASFEHRDRPTHVAEMFSTKLRDRIVFRPGEVTAWTGYSGHKKSMFTGQVALDLCVQRERVLIASFEMAPARTIARMQRQCWGVARPKTSQLDVFSEWSDGRLWLFDHIGRVTPDECLAVVRYFAQKCEGSQVFIDSMMMVCKSEEHLDEQKQFVTDTVRTAQETGAHIHIVTHCRKPQTGEEKPPTKYELRGAAAITDQVDNVVTIWANKAKKAALELNPNDFQAAAEPDARIGVEKQRNGEWEGSVKLWFHPASMRFTDDRSSPVDAYRIEP